MSYFYEEIFPLTSRLTKCIVVRSENMSFFVVVPNVLLYRAFYINPKRVTDINLSEMNEFMYQQEEQRITINISSRGYRNTYTPTRLHE